jgi:NADH-quinone oxidoreductase E subunit
MTAEAASGEDQTNFAFTEDNGARAQAIIQRYPAGRQASAVMPLLTLAQDQNGGWLSRAAMDYVAGYLGMPPIRVYEVATFYTMYNLRPIGRHHVQVCTNLPCALRGAQRIVEACRQRLDVAPGETTSDELFTVSEVECLGACVNAPVVQIDHDYYEDLTAETMVEILDTLRAGGTPQAGSRIGRHSCEPVDASAVTVPREHAMGTGPES